TPSCPSACLPPLHTLLPYTTLFRSLSTPFHSLSSFRYRSIPYDKMDKAHIVRSYLDSNALPCMINGFLQQSGPLMALIFIVFLRSEEHTSELQSRFDLVCRLLLENK